MYNSINLYTWPLTFEPLGFTFAIIKHVMVTYSFITYINFKKHMSE